MLLFIIGLACAYQVPLTDKVVSCVKSYVVASAGSVSNAIVMSFGYFFHTVIAGTMNFYWDGKVVDGIPFYRTEAMIKSMLIVPVGLLIGMVGFFYLKL